MRASKPITVTLGPQQAYLESRLASGEYASASEVLRAGLRALEQQETVFDEIIRQKLKEALDDPRPSLSGNEVFDRLLARYAAT